MSAYLSKYWWCVALLVVILVLLIIAIIKARHDNILERKEALEMEQQELSKKAKGEEIQEDLQNAEKQSEGEVANEAVVEEPKKVLYRVVYNKEKRDWEIRKDNAKRVIRRLSTKEEALETVKELSKNNDLKVSVERKDGKVQNN